MTPEAIKRVIEAAILVADAPVSTAQLRALFKEEDGVDDLAGAVRQALNETREDVAAGSYTPLTLATDRRG